MNRELLLSLDAGSGGAKCFLVDNEGKIIASSSEEWLRNNWNTEVGWSAFRAALRYLLDKNRVNPRDIVGITTTSMREEFVMLDDEGKEIRYTIDPNIYAHGNNLNNKHGSKIYRISGRWPVPGWIAAAKLAWIRDKKPDIFKKIKTFLMISDWLAYALGADPYTEASSACETGLFDVSTIKWSLEIIEDLNLPIDIFQEVKENSVLAGVVSSSTASETGLKAGTPIFVGGADTQCGLLGVGAIEERHVTAVCGTTTPVQMITNKPVFDLKKRTWTNNHILKSKWIVESNAGKTGWVYRWFRDQMMTEERSKFTYENVNLLAETTTPGSNGLRAYLGPRIFNSGPPYWSGDRLSDVKIPSAIIGSATFSKGDLARAIIEANCYAIRANLEQLVEITGIKPEALRVCGGSSKSLLWMHIQSDVLNLPLILPREKDATAVGAATLAATGAGLYTSMGDAIKAMIKYDPLIEPNQDRACVYEQLYRDWRDTRRRLSRTF